MRFIGFLPSWIVFVCATLAHQDDIIPTKEIGRDVHGLPVLMPLVGAGTWQYNDTAAYQSLCKAFGQGITFVDTAFGYGNQKGVGNAIRDCFEGRRSDLFLMTKVPGGLSRQKVLAAHHQNMFELDLEHVDHLMTHFPADWQVHHASKQLRQEEWLALEEIYYSGKARSIGVSHYCPQHIQDILEVATVRPSINQVEYHVGSGDVDHVREACREHQITFLSFSPLCGPCQYEPSDSLIDGTLVSDIAQKYNVTGAQVSLRFVVQQALDESYMGGVIPKSNNVDHIRSNRDLFSFSLSDEDMERLHHASNPAAEAGDCDVP